MSVELLPADNESIYAVPQHPSEPMIAYEAFCVYLESGTLANGKPDLEVIKTLIWERKGFQARLEEIEVWAKRFDWETRAKYYRSGVHQQVRDVIEKSARELKIRRHTVINERLDECLRMMQKLQPLLEEDLPALSPEKKVAAYATLGKVELMLLKEQRIELGEESVGGGGTINFNIDMILNAFGSELDISPEKLEAVRSAFIRMVSEQKALEDG